MQPCSRWPSRHKLHKAALASDPDTSRCAMTTMTCLVGHQLTRPSDCDKARSRQVHNTGFVTVQQKPGSGGCLAVSQVHRNAQGRREYSNLLREGQVTTELVVMDPNDA